MQIENFKITGAEEQLKLEGQPRLIEKITADIAKTSSELKNAGFPVAEFLNDLALNQEHLIPGAKKAP